MNNNLTLNIQAFDSASTLRLAPNLCLWVEKERNAITVKFKSGVRGYFNIDGAEALVNLLGALAGDAQEILDGINSFTININSKRVVIGGVTSQHSQNSQLYIHSSWKQCWKG
jgi:hypothetical protein